MYGRILRFYLNTAKTQQASSRRCYRGLSRRNVFIQINMFWDIVPRGMEQEMR